MSIGFAVLQHFTILKRQSVTLISLMFMAFHNFALHQQYRIFLMRILIRRETRDNRPLGRDPDRGWYHSHTSLKHFCSQPWFHGHRLQNTSVIYFFGSLFSAILRSSTKHANCFVWILSVTESFLPISFLIIEFLILPLLDILQY